MRFFVPVLCVALAASASSAALHAAPASSAPTQATLTKGTPIRLRLETELQSGRDKTGEPVLWTVSENVYGPNHSLLLEKGASAHGHVSESSGRGAFGRKGKLKFTCDYASADDGTRIPLDLVVSPGRGGSSEPVGEVAASVHTSSRGPYPYVTPEGYANGYADGYPGGFYEPAGGDASVSVDPGRLLGSGADAKANRGQEYEAQIAGDTRVIPPAPLAASSEQLFTLKDKSQAAGTLAGFDGQTYTLATPTGRRSIKASDVQTIQAVSAVP